MEVDTVMNFILRFYHLEHVANRRHPALREKLRSGEEAAQRALSPRCWRTRPHYSSVHGNK